MNKQKNRRCLIAIPLFALILVAALAFVQGCTVSSYGDVQLTSITIKSASASTTMPSDTYLQLTATGVYSDGTTTDVTSSATWTSDSAVASVVSGTNGGQIHAAASVSADTPCTITATEGGVSGSISVTVKDLHLSSIVTYPTDTNLSATAPSIANGTKVQFKAVGTYVNTAGTVSTDQEILPQNVSWSSSAAGSVASIDAHGLVSSVAPGSTLITAGSGTISGNVSLTVTSATLTAISINYPTRYPRVKPGKTLQLSAIGTFTDGTTTTYQDLTTQVAWSSSSPDVATVSNAGLVTGVVTSTTKSNITATFGSISNYVGITVPSAAAPY